MSDSKKNRQHGKTSVTCQRHHALKALEFRALKQAMIHPCRYAHFSKTSTGHFWQLGIFCARAAAIFATPRGWCLIAKVGMVGGFKYVRLHSEYIKIYTQFSINGGTPKWIGLWWNFFKMDDSKIPLHVYNYTEYIIYTIMCFCLSLRRPPSSDALLFAIAGAGSAMHSVRRQVTFAQQHGLFRAATALTVIYNLLKAMPLGKNGRDSKICWKTP